MTAKTLQLLLVEDNPAHAELIRQAFLSYDRQVYLTVVRSLQEARATLATTQPDLAIIDLLLPDGRGLELLPGDEKRLMMAAAAQDTAERFRATGIADNLVTLYRKIKDERKNELHKQSKNEKGSIPTL